MRSLPFDWRWLTLIAFVLLIVNAGRLPAWLVAVLVGGGGVYILNYGWQVWNRRARGGPAGTRVTYWRGQRIEVRPARRGRSMPRLDDIGPAAIYLLLGGAMVAAAASIAYNALVR